MGEWGRFSHFNKMSSEWDAEEIHFEAGAVALRHRHQCLALFCLDLNHPANSGNS